MVDAVEGMSSSGGRRTRSGSRKHREKPNLKANQRPFKQPRRHLPPTNAISEDELEALHQSSLKILSEVGMDVLFEEAKGLFREAGADVDGDRVRLAPELVESLIATAPETITLHARNPAHSINMGGDWVTFSGVSSPPNSTNIDLGRRPGTLPDFKDLVKFTQHFNCLHLNDGYPVEPVDIHASIRHLDCVSTFMKLTDKVPHIYSLGEERVAGGMEITRIGRGVSQEQFEREPSLLSVINTSSPLRLDIPMAMGIIRLARAGQATVITPFTLAGAMAPVTIAGALSLQNAEALLGVALSQLAKKGAPVVYGGFTSNVDMKSGAPAFGTPEYMKAALVSGQLARRYKLPFRTSGVCAANSADAQSAYETTFALWGAIMGGGNYIKHAAGWLEGGLSASYEKFMIDADMLSMLQEFLTPLEISQESLAFEAVKDVGPGGHFFGTAHTQERYKDAFYSPIVSDWRNFESWHEAGSPDAISKANGLWKQILHEYEKPALDKAIEDELGAFVTKRKEEGGAPTDF